MGVQLSGWQVREDLRISPVPKGIVRPLWSVMIPTYNRPKYVEQALLSVLEQDPGAQIMQIEVVDNCSPPEVQAELEAMIARVGRGRVTLYKQPRNMGLVGNLNTCIKRAHGHLLHILHDDDLVLPGFYQRLQIGFAQSPMIGAAFCRYVHINERNQQTYRADSELSIAGVLHNWIARIFVRNQLQPPAIAVKRSVYETLGGYRPELSHTVDWDMWQRIAGHGYAFWYEPQVLACYRVHSGSDTSEVIRSGRNLAEQRQAIAIASEYLSPTLAEQLGDKARETCALWGLTLARRALVRGDLRTARNQIREALKCSGSPKVLTVLGFMPLLALLRLSLSRIRAWQQRRQTQLATGLMLRLQP